MIPDSITLDTRSRPDDDLARPLFAHWPVPADFVRPLTPGCNRHVGRERVAGRRPLPDDARPTVGCAAAGRPVRLRGDRRPDVRLGPWAPGAWSFSLHGQDRLASWAARRAFHLPYWYARVRLRHAAEGWIDFAGRHDGERTALFRGRYRPTGPVSFAAPGSFEAFLTDGLSLYAARGRGELPARMSSTARGRSSRPSSSRRSTPWPPRTGSRCRTLRPTCSSHAGSRSQAAEPSGSSAVAMTPTRR